jgi:hypothetical protein
MWQTIKNWWLAIGIVITIMGTVVGTLVDYKVWAADVNKKMSAIEEVQVKQAALEDKMFDFIMNLWKIEPEQVNKWKEFPTEPTVRVVDGDTVFNDWIEFEGFDRLLKYHVVVDTAGSKHIYVDTLFETEGQ